MSRHPEDLTFEDYQFHPVLAMVRGAPYVPRYVVDVRDYIVAHAGEDITPRSVCEHFGLPYNRTRSSFSTVMGESMESMIRRLKDRGTDQ